MSKITRRKALAALGAGAGALGAASAFGPGFLRRRSGVAHAAAPEDRRFLITVGATGGASIIDSFLAVRESEVTAAGGDPAVVNAFPDNQVIDVGPFRAVTMAGAGLSLLGTPLGSIDHSSFATKHQSDMMVVTLQNTSVNHVLAQKRSINGNAAWAGRTLQEMVALTYGADCPVPNANMAAFGFVEPGADTTLAAYAYPEPIANPRFWSLGLDSLKGIKNAPERDILELATRVRDEKLDPESAFFKTFKKSERIQKWMAQRGATKEQIHTLDLITKLTVIPDRPPEFPLAEHGLAQTPDGARILEAFPAIDIDPLHAQAALGYLLIKYGVSTSVTLSPSFNPVLIDLPEGGFLLLLPPLAFDNSHGAHRQTQAFMWFRLLDVIDKMSDLLKEDQFLETGESLYDRSLFYVATDFGRTKVRQNGAANFGSGHDLNNGALILCPKGKAGVFGGVHHDTCQTYGFDLTSGLADQGRTTYERELYAGILQLLGVDTTEVGLPDVKAFRP
jgi:hypothetical protein